MRFHRYPRNSDLPLVAAVEAGLATSTRAALGAVYLAVTNLATLEAGLITSSATSLVAIAEVTEVVARAGVAPSVTRVGRHKVEASVRREARSVATPGVGAVVSAVLDVLLVLGGLLLNAVALGVLVSRPVSGIDDSVASLAESGLADLSLSLVVRVGRHARRKGQKLCTTHGCCCCCCCRGCYDAVSTESGNGVTLGSEVR